MGMVSIIWAFTLVDYTFGGRSVIDYTNRAFCSTLREIKHAVKPFTSSESGSRLLAGGKQGGLSHRASPNPGLVSIEKSHLHKRHLIASRETCSTLLLQMKSLKQTPEKNATRKMYI